MRDECSRCKYRTKKMSIWGGTFDVCRNECGEYHNNSGHPLSPCVQWDCKDEEDAECQTEEYAIIDGNRCSTYCAWLHFMRAHQEKVMR